jgi:SAM-dependent methyltransferase
MASAIDTRGSSIAYFREAADERFWSHQWAQSSIADLLAIVEISPATAFLQQYVQPGLRVIEAGCGLGQYVAYFSERGVDITGVDYSQTALHLHRQTFPRSQLCFADLSNLPYPEGCFDVYISLGVIEHYRDGGRAILAEAARVLSPNGCLVVSTPYLNGARRLLRRRIDRQQRRIAAAGGGFYQYAFDERGLDKLIAAAGFDVEERSYYDPGRGVREMASMGGVRAAKLRLGAPGQQSSPRESVTRRGLRRLLYSRPSLLMFAHMQIIAATRHTG